MPVAPAGVPGPTGGANSGAGNMRGGSVYGAAGSRTISGVRSLKGLRLSQAVLPRLAELHGRYTRGAPNARRAVLTHCDFSGLDLRGLDFSSGEFVACVFDGADLRGARFHAANIFGGRFRDADLRASEFERADLRGAAFDQADLSDARLQGADLREGAVVCTVASLPQKPRHSSFRGARLERTRLDRCRAKGGDFTDAVVHFADFSGADLRETLFHGAELIGAVLRGSRIAGADFRGAFCDDPVLREIDAGEARGADRRTVLTDGDLQARVEAHAVWILSGGGDGIRFVLPEADLRGRQLAAANLAAADLSRAVLAEADLRGAMLAAADLSHANLVRADLRGADLRGANLASANLRDARLEGVRTGELPGTGLSTAVAAGFRRGPGGRRRAQA